MDIRKLAVDKHVSTRKDDSVIDNYFGFEVADPYRWLEDDTSAETAEWVNAQREITAAWFAQIPFREKIRLRYEQLFNFEKYSAPSEHGDYIYYTRNTGLQDQSVVYRERKGATEPELFLDPNSFSTDGTSSLAGLHFTNDGSLATYQVSGAGSDWTTMVVIETAGKSAVGDKLNDVKFSGASWYRNEGFYYSSYDKPVEGSPLSAKTQVHKLYYHKLGTAQADDLLIFGGQDQPRRYVSGAVTEDQNWLVITAANSTYGNELYVKDLRRIDAPILPLITDTHNNHYILDTDEHFFYIQTDKGAPNGKIVVAPVNDPAPANWETLIAEKPEVLTASTGGSYLFCSYLKDAVNKVFQYAASGELVREIELPGLGTALGFYARKEATELFYSFTSYTTPATIFRLRIADGEAEVYKKSKVAFEPADYESKQIFYSSKDGTQIPMIITYKKGLTLNGRNPCLLYGYGGFSVSLTPAFSTSNIILLENGGIYAVANIRGGGEYGEDWHQQGIRMKKQNVFDDFMAAAQYLKDNHYTSTDYLAIEGGSNGGLLVGACITQQPGICRVALPAVGVLDMLRYHQFTAGAGWAYDYGTAEENKEMFEYLYRYSPLHNIQTTAYPATLITTADHDDRVVPAHSFKFAATLQEKNNGPYPVLISIGVRTGHGAGRSTRQTIEDQANKWSFLFYNMGIDL